MVVQWSNVAQHPWVGLNLYEAFVAAKAQPAGREGNYSSS